MLKNKQRLARFLNADLDLISRRDLSTLTSALERCELFAISNFRDGRRYCAGFETCRAYRTAEQCVRLVLAALDRLEAAARTELAACSRRELNLGFQCASTSPGRRFSSFEARLSPETLVRLHGYGLGLAVTLYSAVREPRKKAK